MITILTIAVIALVVEGVVVYVRRWKARSKGNTFTFHYTNTETEPDFATKLMEELDKALEKAQQTSEG